MRSSTAGAEFVGAAVPPAQIAADVVFLPVFGEADKLDDVAGLDASTGGELGRARARGEFRAKAYDIFITPVTAPGWRAGRVALVGAGRREDFDPERMRRVAAACGYFARRRRILSIGFVVRGASDAFHAAQCVADGLSQADFVISAYKQDESAGSAPAKVVISVPDGDAGQIGDAVRRGRIIGRASNFARELANEPGNVLTPREFAARVEMRAHQCGPLGRGPRRNAACASSEDGPAARRRAGQRGAAAPDRHSVRAARRTSNAGARVRGQGRDVRLGRHLDQAGRRHGADEGRHVRRRGRGGGAARAGRAQRPVSRHRRHSDGREHAGRQAIRPATCSRARAARRSRSSTPTPRGA